MSTRVIIAGGLNQAQTLQSIYRGFERAGCKCVYLPTEELQTRKSGRVSKVTRGGVWDTMADHVEDADLLFWWQPQNGADATELQALRDTTNVPFVMQSLDDPFVLDRPESAVFGAFDHAVTCCEGSCDWYEARGVQCLVGYPAVDPQIHGTAEAAEKHAVDISFVATNCYPRVFYPHVLADRACIVRRVAPLGTLALYGPCGETDYDWQLVGRGLRSDCRGSVDYETAAVVFASSKINLNSHVRPDGYKYLNERVTHVMASGGFMLCDAVNGIDEVLPEGTYDMWHNLDELKDKATYWLAHDAERRQVAQKAREFALEEFSGQRLAHRILDQVQ